MVERASQAMKNVENKVTIYLLAGVATSENFLDDFKHELIRRYELAGLDVEVFVLYPYGDWSRRLWKQVLEISSDYLPRFVRAGRSMRGQMVADSIQQTYRGGLVVIIGHSSGGMVGVHAAHLLLNRDQFAHVRIVQIGSPKCAVSPELRHAILYIRAVNKQGKLSDPITRIGSWGGWKFKGTIARWDLRLRAPAAICNVTIVGGHADYFRVREPFVDEHGKSNLAKTSDLIWNWLEVFIIPDI